LNIINLPSFPLLLFHLDFVLFTMMLAFVVTHVTEIALPWEMSRVDKGGYVD
jgi:hypothetical protein